MASRVFFSLFVLFCATGATPQKNDLCPDKQHSCPEGWTCCKLQQSWGCCPLPQAVCCQDHAHCCPQGAVCDTATGSCMDPFQSNFSMPWYTKVPAIRREESNKDCPSAQGLSCPGTCCKETTGTEACCPLKDAVCCSGADACCPKGFICDVPRLKCVKPSSLLHQRYPVKLSPADIQCPGKQQRCATGTTCCPLPSGHYGCCPAEQAVCCSDHLHCCPHGTTCDLPHGTCLRKEEPGSLTDKDSFRFPFSTIIHTGRAKQQAGCSFCGAKNACCKKQDGSYSCCAFREAVCCKYADVCCPIGTSCISAGGESICSRRHGHSTTAAALGRFLEDTKPNDDY